MYLTLDEYWTDARKIMCKFGGADLEKNDDNVAHVVYNMIMADKKYENKSKRTTWRLNHAKYAMMQIRTNNKRNKKKRMLSLDYIYFDDCALKNQFVNKKNKKYQEKYVECVEMLDIAKDILNDRDYQIFYNRFVKNMTYAEIGRIFSLTKERIRQILKYTKRKVKNACET